MADRLCGRRGQQKLDAAAVRWAPEGRRRRRYMIPSALSCARACAHDEWQARSACSARSGLSVVLLLSPGNRERKICDIIAELIGVPAVGLADNFLELGGHSLHALELVSRLRARFDVELSVPDVFRASTIAAIAAVIEWAPQAVPIARAVR